MSDLFMDMVDKIAGQAPEPAKPSPAASGGPDPVWAVNAPRRWQNPGYADHFNFYGFKVDGWDVMPAMTRIRQLFDDVYNPYLGVKVPGTFKHLMSLKNVPGYYVDTTIDEMVQAYHHIINDIVYGYDTTGEIIKEEKKDGVSTIKHIRENVHVPGIAEANGLDPKLVLEDINNACLAMGYTEATIRSFDFEPLPKERDYDKHPVNDKDVVRVKEYEDMVPPLPREYLESIGALIQTARAGELK